jgi:hypothetical protein
LAGIQIGCFELFGSERVRAIRDLKGKTVAAGPLGGSGHTFLASMATFVGLKPATDITWVDSPERESLRLFAEGSVDAVMASTTADAGSPGQEAWTRGRQYGDGSALVAVFLLPDGGALGLRAPVPRGDHSDNQLLFQYPLPVSPRQ